MTSKQLSAIVTSAVALVFLVLNLSQDNLESYLFPLLLAAILCGLSLLFLLSALALVIDTDDSRQPVTIDWVAIGPGIVVGIAYYLCLEILGFYSASYLAFFAIITLYDQQTPINYRSVLIKSLVSALFIAALYGLFYSALHVQTPGGLLF